MTAERCALCDYWAPTQGEFCEACAIPDEPPITPRYLNAFDGSPVPGTNRLAGSDAARRVRLDEFRRTLRAAVNARLGRK